MFSSEILLFNYPVKIIVADLCICRVPYKSETHTFAQSYCRSVCSYLIPNKHSLAVTPLLFLSFSRVCISFSPHQKGWLVPSVLRPSPLTLHTSTWSSSSSDSPGLTTCLSVCRWSLLSAVLSTGSSNDLVWLYLIMEHKAHFKSEVEKWCLIKKKKLKITDFFHEILIKSDFGL